MVGIPWTNRTHGRKHQIDGVVPCVSVSRSPTEHDTQYPLLCEWRVTAGPDWGKVYKLVGLIDNEAYWLQMQLEPVTNAVWSVAGQEADANGDVKLHVENGATEATKDGLALRLNPATLEKAGLVKPSSQHFAVEKDGTLTLAKQGRAISNLTIFGKDRDGTEIRELSCEPTKTGKIALGFIGCEISRPPNPTGNPDLSCDVVSIKPFPVKSGTEGDGERVAILNDSQFQVEGNFVSLKEPPGVASIGAAINGVMAKGNVVFKGYSHAQRSRPVQCYSSTKAMHISVQRATIADGKEDVHKVGLAAFDHRDFEVNSDGVVSLRHRVPNVNGYHNLIWDWDNVGITGRDGPLSYVNPGYWVTDDEVIEITKDIEFPRYVIDQVIWIYPHGPRRMPREEPALHYIHPNSLDCTLGIADYGSIRVKELFEGFDMTHSSLHWTYRVEIEQAKGFGVLRLNMPDNWHYKDMQFTWMRGLDNKKTGWLNGIGELQLIEGSVRAVSVLEDDIFEFEIKI